jgi:hypothetical protein
MATPTQRFLSYALLACGVAFSLSANIETQNPFLPPNYGVKPTTPAPPTVSNGPLARELELRGIIKIGDRFQFSIFSKKGNTSYWITENQNEAGLYVRDFDASDNSVLVTQNGRTERISLNTANDKPLPIKNSGAVVSRNVTRKTPTPSTLPAILQGKAKPSNSSGTTGVIRRRVILPKK